MKSIVRAAGVLTATTGLVFGGVGIALATAGTSPPKPTPAAASIRHVNRQLNVSAPSPAETVFTPIAPCKLADTTLGTSARSLQITGSAVTGQGGQSGGCAIPSSATAIAANLVVSKEAKPGYLLAYPTGATTHPPVLNYATATLDNALTLSVTPGSSPGVTVQANAALRLRIDVSGYYAPQIEAYIVGGSASSPASIDTATPRVVSVTRIGVGSTTVTIDRNVSSCSATVMPYAPGEVATGYTTGTTVQVTVVNASNNAVDTNYNLQVNC